MEMLVERAVILAAAFAVKKHLCGEGCAVQSDRHAIAGE